MINKRGLSTIVVILIIVLLSLVAAGIIWAVVKGIIQIGVGQIDISAKCMNVDVKATKVVNTSATIYSVTFERESGGDEIDGIKLVFTNATGETNYIHDVPGNIAVLATKTESNIETISTDNPAGIPNADNVDVRVYFNDEAGTEQLCSKANSYSF